MPIYIHMRQEAQVLEGSWPQITFVSYKTGLGKSNYFIHSVILLIQHSSINLQNIPETFLVSCFGIPQRSVKLRRLKVPEEIGILPTRVKFSSSWTSVVEPEEELFFYWPVLWINTTSSKTLFFSQPELFYFTTKPLTLGFLLINLTRG